MNKVKRLQHNNKRAFTHGRRYLGAGGIWRGIWFTRTGWSIAYVGNNKRCQFLRITPFHKHSYAFPGTKVWTNSWKWRRKPEPQHYNQQHCSCKSLMRASHRTTNDWTLPKGTAPDDPAVRRQRLRMKNMMNTILRVQGLVSSVGWWVILNSRGENSCSEERVLSAIRAPQRGIDSTGKVASNAIRLWELFYIIIKYDLLTHQRVTSTPSWRSQVSHD